MTPDLKWLAWTVVLTFVILMVAAVGVNAKVGLVKAAGNREDMPKPDGWAGRASRAHQNMMESFPLFAALILIAHAANLVNGTVILGAQLFFWGRVAHAVLYVAGVPWVRTLAWMVAVLGMLLIFLQLV